MTFSIRTVFEPEFTEKEGRSRLKTARLRLERFGKNISTAKKGEEKSATITLSIRFVTSVRKQEMTDLTKLAELTGTIQLDNNRLPVFTLTHNTNGEFLQNGFPEDKITKGIIVTLSEASFPKLAFSEEGSTSGKKHNEILLEFPPAPDNALYAELTGKIAIDEAGEDNDELGDCLDIGLFPAPLQLGNIHITLIDDKTQEPLAEVPYVLTSDEGPEFEGTTDDSGIIEHKKVPVVEYQLVYDKEFFREEGSEEPSEETSDENSPSETEATPIAD